ncbi:hypothetical protein ACFQL1_08570 [Halomicroarcula sp. GCM10025709]|uniref:DUF7287 family protein n=1 Tax=Haloarcula TaxID=2237 RepID=UPI0024C325AB|nr:hypothetical protein [Halomicroarcula sp. YJ-61-S]
MIDRGRGQTMLDFAVAVGLFLLTVAFVVAFVPQVTAPYQEQAHPAVAQRVAGGVADNLLAGDAPSVLDEDCTVAFFAQSGAAGCPFDTTAPLTEQVGVGPRHRLNLSLQRNVSGDATLEVLCGNGGAVGPCGTDPLRVGPAPPADRSLTTTRRAVAVGGTDAVLEVTVW